MGNYITGVAQVLARFPRSYSKLYDSSGSVDEAWVTADIAEAEGVVDGYLAVRYAVPVSGGSTGLLLSWALALVEELAYRRAAHTSIPEKVKDAADTARKQLADCARGDFSLGAAEVPSERSGASGTMVVEGETPEFERSDMAGW